MVRLWYLNTLLDGLRWEVQQWEDHNGHTSDTTIQIFLMWFPLIIVDCDVKSSIILLLPMNHEG